MSYVSNSAPVTSRRPHGGLGLIFVLVGVVAFLGLATAAVIVGVNEQRKSDWPVTDGTVIDVVERQSTRRDSDGHRTTSTTWAPVVTYTVDGKQYQFTSSVSTSSIPSVGDTMQVRYNPEDPSDASLAKGVMWVVFLLGGMALLFLAIFGGVGMVLRRSQRPGPPPPYQQSNQQWNQQWNQTGNQPGTEPDGPIDPSEPR